MLPDKYRVPIVCAQCGRTHRIAKGEMKRQIARGRTRFFCGASCAARYGNEVMGHKAVEVTKECPTCHREFQSSTRRRAATFCSRGCASRGSVTDYRREKAKQVGRKNAHAMNTPESRAVALRAREFWKYAALHDYLEREGIPHIFEFPLGNAVFDMALPSLRLLVEFDGKYHQDPGQRERDAAKSRIVEVVGWRLVRAQVETNAVIPPSALREVLLSDR